MDRHAPFPPDGASEDTTEDEGGGGLLLICLRLYKIYYLVKNFLVKL